MFEVTCAGFYLPLESTLWLFPCLEKCYMNKFYLYTCLVPRIHVDIILRCTWWYASPHCKKAQEQLEEHNKEPEALTCPLSCPDPNQIKLLQRQTRSTETPTLQPTGSRRSAAFNHYSSRKILNQLPLKLMTVLLRLSASVSSTVSFSALTRELKKPHRVAVFVCERLEEAQGFICDVFEEGVVWVLQCKWVCVSKHSRSTACPWMFTTIWVNVVCVCLVHVCMNASLCVQSLLQGSGVGWREEAFFLCCLKSSHL